MAKTATYLLYGDILGHEEKSEVTIFGDIEVPGVTSKDVNDFIENNKDADELIIRINSRGGSVQEGFLIYDLLTGSGKKITTIGEGKVFSIATVAFLAGDKRIMLEHADGLIHNPHIPEYTLADKYESDDLEKIADYLRQEEEKVLEFYAKHTGTDKEKLRQYMQDETMLSADDMVTLGFATETRKALKAVAYFNIKPQKSSKMEDFEKKADGFIDRLQKVLGKFSRISGKNMDLVDASGNEFHVEREEGKIQVGDVARPDGTYTMENGQKIVVSEGKITEIKDPEDNETEDLKAENDQLKDQVTTQEAEILDLKAQVGELSEAAAEVETLIADLKSFKSMVTVEGRKKTFQGTKKVEGVDKERVSEMLNKITEDK